MLQSDEEISFNRAVVTSDGQITSNTKVTSDGDVISDQQATLDGKVISDGQITFGGVVLPGESADPLETQLHLGTPPHSDKCSVEQGSFEPIHPSLDNFPTHSLCDCYSTDEVVQSPPLKTPIQLLCPPGCTALPGSFPSGK